MIGNKLITKQTGSSGRVCNAVMLAEARTPHHEYYVAVLNDRSTQLPVLITSNQGGMSIEDVAHENPDAIITTPIDFHKGLTQDSALEIAKKLGFTGKNRKNKLLILLSNCINFSRRRMLIRLKSILWLKLKMEKFFGEFQLNS